MKRSLLLLLVSTYALISYSQNVGIGTTAPTSKLSVYTTNAQNTPAIYGQYNGVEDSVAAISGYSTGQGYHQVGVRGQYNGSYYGVGVAGVGYAAQDFPANRDIGVFGSANSYGGYFSSNNAALYAISLSNSYAAQLIGKIQIQDGSEGLNRVLTSDQFGNGTWQVPGASSGWGLKGNMGTIVDTNFIGTSDSVALVIRTNNKDRIYLNASNANVGIGTTTPSYPLHVVGNIYSSSQFLGNAFSPFSPPYAFIGDQQTGTYLPVAGTLGFTIQGTERMRINSSGNVGIGTFSPTYPLHVVGNIYSSSQFLGNAFSPFSPPYAFIGDQQTGTYLPVAGTLGFTIQGTERMRINSSGNVGIGTFSPTYPLHVVGNIYSSSQFLGNAFSPFSPPYAFIGDQQTGTYLPVAGTLGFTIQGTERMRINSSGNVGIGTFSPTYPLHVVGNVYSSSQFLGNAFSPFSPPYAFIGDQQTGTYLPVAGILGFTIQGTERMRINNSGVVGIGTASPNTNTKLDVAGNINANQNAFTITLTADGTVNAGDVVTVSSTTDNRVVQEPTAPTAYKVVGVAINSASAGGAIVVAVQGAVQVTVDGAVTRGDFAAVSATTAGWATDNASNGTKSDFGIFLSSQATSGQKAWVLFKHNDAY